MKPMTARVACATTTLLALIAALSLSACKTSEPGVKSNYISQWTTVAGDTARVTEAARAVLEDLKLQRIDSRSTAVDGWAAAYNADNNKISVDVEKVGADTSRIRVTVGPVGDPALGNDIINRVRQKLD